MEALLLGVGSNIDRRANILAGLQMLRTQFGELQLSPVYESEAVGFSGDAFYNLVVAVRSDLPLAQLLTTLRAMEARRGRRRDEPKFSGRTLDIDILTYGERVGTFDSVLLPRPEITYNAFVLQPLADLLPQALHPQLQRSYARLWQEFDHGSQKLWQITL